MGSENFLYQKMVDNLGFEPTSSQINMFKALSLFIKSNPLEEWMFLVRGYAGTGKTSALSSFVKVLKALRHKYVLLAPTGRAAKVLSIITGEKASTIHKHIYRQKSLNGAIAKFSLNINKASDTIYIVDEVSLISSASESESMFGSGDTLSDLFTFIREGNRNKVVLVGDPAQLPPIGMEVSPALDSSYLSYYTNKIYDIYLTDVVRQASKSGILSNATMLREKIENSDISNLKFKVENFPDIFSISGSDLLEELSSNIDKYGIDEVVVLCRSNLRANKYNVGIRERILFLEEQLQRGDKVMIVKNFYRSSDEGEGNLNFIANGDVATLLRIRNYEERYGLHFADATLMFPDYNDAEIDAKVILDTLLSSSASLDREQQTALFEGVYADYKDIKTKRKRYDAVREDPYYNALQIKYSMAITCHKSQGGQWQSVFIDNFLWKDEITIDDMKWLYTAITRSTERVYLVNFNSKYIE